MTTNEKLLELFMKANSKFHSDGKLLSDGYPCHRVELFELMSLARQDERNSWTSGNGMYRKAQDEAYEKVRKDEAKRIFEELDKIDWEGGARQHLQYIMIKNKFGCGD